MQLTIGITDTEARYNNYPLWIKGADEAVKVIRLTHENAGELAKCDGIVLSGGIDTHPSYYGSQRLNYPLAPDTFNVKRDSFELSVFNYVLEKKVPLLAICRGMQLVNIALGGNMIQDIEEYGKSDHRRHGNVDGKHEITVNKDSLLYTITGSEKGIVNSAHHQALGEIASDLKVTGFSPDGIAESAEWKDGTDKAFLLCVQWHPERLAQEQPDNLFSKAIREHFLKSVIDLKK